MAGKLGAVMKKWNAEWVIYIVFGGILLAAYVGNYKLGWLENARAIKLEMLIVFGMIAAVDFYLLKMKKADSSEIVLWSLIGLGLTMRVGYMLYTGCEIRSHDLWELEADGGGHAGYILTILQSGKLPDSNFRQYYQQPFFYLCGSAVSWLVSRMTGCGEAYELVDAAKLVSCFASGMMLLLGIKILKKTEVPRRAMLPAAALMAFCPAFYLTGGSVVPDALAAFFVILNFYYTRLWEEDKSWKNTLILAAGYGLGMMTKISCATIALFTAVVFIRALWSEKENPGQLIRKYAVFAGISFPLGMWYSFRNLKKFGQSLNYVLEIPHTSELYCGDHSLVQRFLSVSLKELLSSPYADPVTNYNYPVYLLKSSLFGEFQFGKVWDGIPILLMLGAAGVSICVVTAVVWSFLKCRMEQNIYQSSLAYALFLLAGIFFCMKYPVGCSMDFRYMTPVIVFAAPALASFYDKASIAWKKSVYGLIGWYSLLSCFMYLCVS